MPLGEQPVRLGLAELRRAQLLAESTCPFLRVEARSCQSFPEAACSLASVELPRRQPFTELLPAKGRSESRQSAVLCAPRANGRQRKVLKRPAPPSVEAVHLLVERLAADGDALILEPLRQVPALLL